MKGDLIMARPTNKEDLINTSNEEFLSLFNLIDSMTLEKQESSFLFEDRDKNIRDVLTHLHEWHLMMKRWYKDGMSGIKPEIPAKGYTFKTLPDLNNEILKKWQGTLLAEAKELIISSHKDVEELINKHSNEELFTKKHYKWTGSTSLGSYLVSATSSHYIWAIKKIRKHKKLNQKS
jgi:hypothetical protein